MPIDRNNDYRVKNSKQLRTFKTKMIYFSEESNLTVEDFMLSTTPIFLHDSTVFL